MARTGRGAGIATRLVRRLARAPAPRRDLPSSVVASLFLARRLAAGLKAGWVRAGRFEIPFYVGGRGEPLVLLHGFGDSKDGFIDTAAELTRRYQVFVPDLPGHGGASQPLHFDYTLDNLAAVMGAFAAAVGLERFHVVGNSLGGAVALGIALAEPSRVRTMVLLNAAGTTMPTPSATMRRIDSGHNPFIVHTFDESEELLALLMESPPPIPWPVRRWLAQQFIKRGPMNAKIWADLIAHDPDLTARLRDVQAPTLALWGDCDRVVDLSAGRVIAREITGARLVILHGVGHCPQLEAPTQTAERIAEFVSGEYDARHASAARRPQVTSPRFQNRQTRD